MVKYYLIPKSLEILTAQLQTAWLNKSENAFVCMRGVYKQVQNEVQNEFTTVRNQTPNKNEVSYVFKKYKDFNLIGELINYELHFFLLEGELDAQTEYVANLYNIQSFQTNIEILEYFLLEGELDAQTEYVATLYNIQSFANNELIITYLQENNLI